MLARSLNAAIALAVFLAGTTASAQAVRPPKPLPPAVSISSTSMLRQAQQSGWLKVNVQGGKIVNAGTRRGTSSSSSRGTDHSETLRTTYVNGVTSVSYDRTDKKMSFSLQVTGSDKINISSKNKGEEKATSVDFEQQPGMPIKLTLSPPDGKPLVYEGRSLWHLMLMHPQECRTYLMPMLETLRSNWELAETADAVEKALLKVAAEGKVPSHELWDRLVAQLSDDSFWKREKADAALRAVGPSVLAYLEDLDFYALEPEQQIRIRRIIRYLSAKASQDDVDTIVKTMISDKNIWLAMLSREDEKTRQAAAKWLSALQDKPIDFDPDADEETRTKQIERLRIALGLDS